MSNSPRFYKQEVADMKFIVDDSTKHEHNGNISYKAYATSDLTIDDLVDLLNQFDEENRYLKEQLKDYTNLQKEYNVTHRHLVMIAKEELDRMTGR